jgi:hypothetical protein
MLYLLEMTCDREVISKSSNFNNECSKSLYESSVLNNLFVADIFLNAFHIIIKTLTSFFKYVSTGNKFGVGLLYLLYTVCAFCIGFMISYHSVSFCPFQNLSRFLIIPSILILFVGAPVIIYCILHSSIYCVLFTVNVYVLYVTAMPNNNQIQIPITTCLRINI